MIVTSDELARRNPAIPRITATNGHYSYEGAVGAALAPDAPDSPLRHKPILLLARNPCDIAVSWYFQFTRRQSAHKQELINHSSPIRSTAARSACGTSSATATSACRS